MIDAALARVPRRLRQTGLAVLVAGLAVTGVLASGLDAQRTETVESAVWVMRAAGQYARVDTDLGEIDTVRLVADPSTVVQSGGEALLLTSGLHTRWAVDPADPADLEQAGEGSSPSPTGTVDVASAGSWVAYLTDSGRTWVQQVSDGAVAPATALDPAPELDQASSGATDQASDDEPADPYAADLVAVDDAGAVAVYSQAERAVRVLDAATGEVTAGPTALEQAPDDADPLSIALVGSRWAVLDQTGGRLWVQDLDAPVQLGTTDAVLQQSATVEGPVRLADRSGLLEVDATGELTRPVEASGTPAVPVVLEDGTVVAAWLAETGGTLWTGRTDASGDTVPLTDDDGILAQLRDLTPVIRSNGARAVLEETGSGLLWTVPDGLAVPLGEWSPQDQQLTTQSSSTLEDVAEQMPPTAVADSFGVRAGTDVVLPVLLNDHDPNRKDVLSVVPGTLTALDPSFGTVSLVADDQLAVVHVGDTSGSTTFSYAVTDGYDESTTVSVTLTVVPDGENSAPLWCGVDGCVQPWPSPTLAPGGTATVQLLQGWVDPDGDVLVVDGVELAQTDVPLRVLAGSDGSMTVQHTDANGAAMVVPLSVTVSDVNGASTTRSMQLVVTSAPPLELTPRVLVGAVGDTSTVGVLDLVVSGSGAYRLVDASVAGATGTLDVVPNAAAGTVQLTPSGPGDYPVTVTVADVATGEEKSVVVRLRIPEDGAALTVAPTTVYVRQHEDTTVDVLAAVQSTSDGVLTVSSATTAYPAIGVDVIEARAVRVRAIDLGASPGPLGRVTVTVTDGLGGSADGVVTVVLAETGADEAVIAMPDTATVRAGAVVSIPVTANDVAPRGARLALEPDVVGSGTPGELVYTSGDTVRYLAPQVPGTYRLTYSVVRSGRPSILSSNVVTVTVVAPGQNRPPTPATLVARVSAGTSVTIPFSGTGLDPDGDAVQLVGLVQPEPGLGAASITSDGTGIVFVPGPTLSGGEQVQLGYRVRDAQGATATGAVRVAVQPAVAASAPPVAYTDYLRVRQGEQVPLRFEPLLNDHDPAGGTLELVGLRPEAPGAAGNEEFDRLNHLVVDSGLPGGGAAGQVQLTAGDVLGSHAYVYTVLSSASGSTAEGLIVVEVTPAAVVDKPEVADTVVTAARRSELSTTGIDVVSGRVVWPSGDASGLTLAVWGDSRTWHAEGARIVGPAPPQGAVVPFVLTGVDAGGRSVRSYGLLVIPALDDMRLTLAPGTTPLQVAEGETVVGAVRPLLALGPADTVELRASDRLPVQRSAARCSTSGDELTYVAGNGGPWSDSCTVQVRLPGQESWSDVVVPVGVEPQNPQPVLTSMSRTVAPGAVETIDLTQMLSWEGGRVGDVSTLDLTASLAPGTFDLQQDGSSATVTAAADAVPGSRMTVDVRLAPYDLRASIELVVGVAAQDAPRGATLVSACDVSSGRSCTVRVVGVAGEYDPFAGLRGAGLTLGQVGTGGTVTCSVATVTSAGTQDVTVTWPAVPKPAGGTCTVPFTVVDAQGRTGAGELLVDLQGYPAAPASVTAAAYTASGVTLDVALGDGAGAHPAVDGVSVYEDGRPVDATCRSTSPSSFRCEVAGLVNGQPHAFTARSRNAVGESTDSTAVTTWAYRGPEIGSVTAEPVYDASATTPTHGVVRLTIESADDAAAFQVSTLGQPVQRSGEQTTVMLTLPVGGQTVTVTPLSRFTPPSGAVDASGQSREVAVTVAGSPLVSPGTATTQAQQVVVSGAAVDPNGSTRLTSLQVGAFTRADAARCTMANGQAVLTGQGTVSGSGTIDGLANDTEYTVVACGSNGYGAAMVTVGTVYVFAGFDVPQVRSGYRIGTSPVRSGAVFTWASVTQPDVRTTEPQVVLRYRVDGGSWSDAVSLPTGRLAPLVEVRQCSRLHADACSDPVEVPMASGSAPGTVVVTFPTTCLAEPAASDVGLAPSGLNDDGAAAVVEVATETRTDRGVDYLVSTWTVTWTGAYAALDTVSADDAAARCVAPPPP